MENKKESKIEKELGDDSPLKKLIKIFRTNTVVKHHFQGAGSRKPEGVASMFFKDSLSWASSVIPGYTAYERFAKYSDFCEMIAYPVIGKALQVFADEATQKDEDGKIIKITSESKEVEDILQDLLDNVLQLNGKKIYKMVRDLCKYGDTFYLIDITTANGVVNLIQMPANEVEREEGFDKKEPTAVRFKWNSRGNNGNQEIPNAFVCHFRLDGDDLNHPYGMSVLEAARRPWRQLCLSANSIIWTKSGHKKICELTNEDQVYGFDQKTETVKLVKIKNVVKTGEKATFTLKTAHRELNLTSDHKVLVKTASGDFEYKEARDVRLNVDKIVCATEVGACYEAAVSFDENEIEEVYDIEVDDDLHNFVANGIVVHNCLLEDAMMVYRITRSAERRAFYLDVMGVPPENVEEVVNKVNQELKKKRVVNEEGKIDLRFGAALDMSEDIIVPVRGGDSGTRIETLPGGQNIGDIEDIEFIQKNLFAALGIPKAFLTYDEGIGAKQVLTMEDVRFARTISKIQEAVISELVKICLIHLYIKGIRGRDLLNFKIKMTNPSTVAEMQKNELWRARMDLVQSAGQGVFDTTFIYKQFLRLSDDAIDLVRKGQIQDKIFQSKLLSIESAGGQAGAMGGLGGLGGGLGGGFGGGGLGGLGGGLVPGGGMPGLGPDLGGAAPNVGGMPPLPEGFNPAANVTAPGGGKDMTRRSANERIGTLRGHDEDNVVSMEDVENSIDDGLDISGMKRTITSPMGIAKEAANIHKELMESLNKISINQEDRYTIVSAKNMPLQGVISYLEEKLGRETTTQIITEEVDLEMQLEQVQEKVNKVL